MAYELITTAERMLAIPSVTSEGTADLIAYLERTVVPHLPGEAVVQADPGGRDGNLLVTVHGREESQGLLLSSHLDTVPPGDPRAWTATGGDPFRPRLCGDRLTGLGSADAKLDWLCKAEAIRRSADMVLRRPVLLLGTYGEERGLVGARRFLDEGAPPAAAALVGEPTECELVTQHKGRLVGTVHLASRDPVVGGRPPGVSHTRRYRGRAAHSATPELGDNAILKALSELPEDTPVIAIRGGDADNKVPERCEVDVLAGPGGSSPAPIQPDPPQAMPPPVLAAARAFAGALFLLAEHQGRENQAFSSSHLTVNIGRVEGRGRSLSLTFDVRPLPGTDVATVRARLDAIAREIEAAHPAVCAQLTVEHEGPPLAPAPPELIELALTVMGAVGLPRRVAAKAGCTEAGLYAAAGIPAAVFGPGRASANIHAPNEWTSVKQLRQAVDFYAAFIQAYCSG